MLDLTLLNSFTGLVDGTNPRPVINVPLNGNLDGGGIGVGSFLRASDAWYMDANNVMQEVAADAERYAGIPGGGGPALLLEGPGTNSCLQSRELGTTWTSGAGLTRTQDQVGIDGVVNTAWTLTDPNESGYSILQQDITVPDDSNTHTLSIFIKKDSDTSRFPRFDLRCFGGTTAQHLVQLNTATGAVNSTSDTDDDDMAYTEDWGDWWRLIITTTNNSTGNTILETKIYPAITTSWGISQTAAVGSIIIDQAQIELNQAYASSPIVTTTVAVTRATESGVADTSGVQWDLNSTLTNMLAETLGSDLVTNGDFAADSDWIKETGWTIPTPVASKTAGTQSTIFQHSVTSGVSTDLYKVTLDVVVTAGGISVWLGQSGFDTGSFPGSRSPQITSTGSYAFYLYPTTVGASKDRLVVHGDSSFIGDIDNIVVKEVTNDSRGTLVVDWTPGAAASVGTNNEGIVTSSENSTATLIYNDAAGTRIRSYDGTNAPQLSEDWDANVTLRIVARWGIDTDNVRMLQVSKVVSGTITNSTAYEYDGAYLVGTLLLLYRAGTWPQQFKNLKFFDTVLTDAQIEAL